MAEDRSFSEVFFHARRIKHASLSGKVSYIAKKDSYLLKNEKFSNNVSLLSDLYSTVALNVNIVLFRLVSNRYFFLYSYSDIVLYLLNKMSAVTLLKYYIALSFYCMHVPEH